MDVYRKAVSHSPESYTRWEAAGLTWLAAAQAVPVVRLLGIHPTYLELERLYPSSPTTQAAKVFGSRLAALHDAGASSFGVPPPGWSGNGWFGPADSPLEMGCIDADRGADLRWGEFYAANRVEPLSAALKRIGVLLPHDEAAFAAVADRLRDGRWDTDDKPARIHGDLWSGNVMWTTRGATLIDPAAHGGHRETDLAMLALFGFPFLGEVMKGYQLVHPLAPGWQSRLEIHQIYPVGVHALIFGGGYIRQIRDLIDRCSAL